MLPREQQARQRGPCWDHAGDLVSDSGRATWDQRMPGLDVSVGYFYLALFISALWVPNMIRKDRSLSRYPEFAGYKARSRLIVPFVL